MTSLIISALVLVIALLTLHGFWLGVVVGVVSGYIIFLLGTTLYSWLILRGL